jgi:hypothetical protein
MRWDIVGPSTPTPGCHPSGASRDYHPHPLRVGLLIISLMMHTKISAFQCNFVLGLCWQYIIDTFTTASNQDYAALLLYPYR